MTYIFNFSTDIRKKIHRVQEILFTYATFFSFILYLITYFGLSTLTPTYLEYLDYIIKIYVCGFLIIRFNPFRKFIEITPLDKKIIFSSSLLLLTNTILTSIFPEILAHFDI